jgi:hypothetical protein
MPSQRTLSLQDRVPKHKHSDTVKTAMAACLGVGERFAARRAELETSGKLTPAGVGAAMRDETSKALKDLVKAHAPIKSIADQAKARRDGLKVRAIDRTDVAGAIERMEIRQFMRGLDIGERRTVAMTTKDPRLLEAMLSAPPELSGFKESQPQLLADIEQRYFNLVHGTDLAAIDATEAVTAEGDAAYKVAASDIQRAAEIGEREFAALLGAAERKEGAPILMRTTSGAVLRIFPDKQNVAGEFQRQATSDEIADGRFLTPAEYEVEFPPKAAA